MAAGLHQAEGGTPGPAARGRESRVHRLLTAVAAAVARDPPRSSPGTLARTGPPPTHAAQDGGWRCHRRADPDRRGAPGNQALPSARDTPGDGRGVDRLVPRARRDAGGREAAGGDTT